jgi:hypothetical protein
VRATRAKVRCHPNGLGLRVPGGSGRLHSDDAVSWPAELLDFSAVGRASRRVKTDVATLP